jgi:hypothetical protein
VHSPQELVANFSRKYGEYLALDRALNGVNVPMHIDDFREMTNAMNMYTHEEHKKNAT